VLTTNQKGAIAEMAIAYEAFKLGIGVLRPISDMRYDLIFDTGNERLRVQCKWASRDGDVIVARLNGNRRARTGVVRSFYRSDEIDAFAVYCPETDRCYFARFDDIPGRGQLLLRTGATRNNQRVGVNWARDFEFGAKLVPVLGP